MCMDAKKIRNYLSAAAEDGTCNCGDDHGSDDKNVAPSVVTGKEQAAEDKSVGITEYGKQTIPYAPAEDASLDLTALALRKDQGPLKDQHWTNPREGNLLAKKYLSMTGRKHPDGTPCKAKSEESCPKMKTAKKDDEADKDVATIKKVDRPVSREEQAIRDGGQEFFEEYANDAFESCGVGAECKMTGIRDGNQILGQAKINPRDSGKLNAEKVKELEKFLSGEATWTLNGGNPWRKDRIADVKLGKIDKDLMSLTINVSRSRDADNGVVAKGKSRKMYPWVKSGSTGASLNEYLSGGAS